MSYEKLLDFREQLHKSGVGASFNLDVEFLPTGIPSFDHSIGGGFARERLSILRGEEHAGKTLILLAAIANVQKAGGTAVFIDGERALTPSFARLLGVDWDKLVVERPKTLDAAYNMIRAYARSGHVDILGFDSTTALTTEEELDTPAEQSGKRASVPQMHSKELPKLIATMNRTACVFINQLRENPNPPVWWKAGKQMYAPGGKALKHYASLMVDVKKGPQHKAGDTVIGQHIKTYADKNKVNTPFMASEFDMMFDRGLDLTTNLIDTAERLGIIERNGSWFNIDIVDMSDGEVFDVRKYSGRKALEDAIRTDTELTEHIELRIRTLNNG